jgi:predicted DNA-binding ribbon-helix-helix protein
MVSSFSNGPASNEDLAPDRQSVLVMRNVSVGGRRTSIRLEPQIWDTLAEICRREFCTSHDVCTHVAARKSPHGSLASSLRVFILDYFRISATEEGHRRVGHGQGMFLFEQGERRRSRRGKTDVPDLAGSCGSSRSSQRARPDPV